MAERGKKKATKKTATTKSPASRRTVFYLPTSAEAELDAFRSRSQAAGVRLSRSDVITAFLIALGDADSAFESKGSVEELSAALRDALKGRGRKRPGSE